MYHPFIVKICAYIAVLIYTAYTEAHSNVFIHMSRINRTWNCIAYAFYRIQCNICCIFLTALFLIVCI